MRWVSERLSVAGLRFVPVNLRIEHQFSFDASPHSASDTYSSSRRKDRHMDLALAAVAASDCTICF